MTQMHPQAAHSHSESLEPDSTTVESEADPAPDEG